MKQQEFIVKPLSKREVGQRKEGVKKLFAEIDADLRYAKRLSAGLELCHIDHAL